ncbi:MAG: leucine-rich repeat-containing protein kinase family protein [Elainellaceae cyanobacterium]
MDSLDTLRSGQLRGARRLDLSCDLKVFPQEIFELAETLEILNLTNNQLTALPDDFGRLRRLKVVFLSRNRFDHLPEVLSQCPHLSMVGFKANQIETVSDRALPSALRWLILTDNCIEQMPQTLGTLKHLQKLMLAGNRLSSLPNLSGCQQLELIRLSANRLSALPNWLFQLPRLAWLAYAGNPCCSAYPRTQPLPDISWNKLTIGEVLGAGASGTILKAKWHQPRAVLSVAVKLFKGQVTSDGLPIDEMQACMAAGSHPHLITAIGRITHHPKSKDGLVLPLVAGYSNLGEPPSLETCTRDTYPPDVRFTVSQAVRIATDIAAAAGYLHNLGLIHGDLYAHNILVNGKGHSLLGDFGAASCYQSVGDEIAKNLERLEVRAFGCLLEELLIHCHDVLPQDSETVACLVDLEQRCLAVDPEQRPLFKAIHDRLTNISVDHASVPT